MSVRTVMTTLIVLGVLAGGLLPGVASAQTKVKKQDKVDLAQCLTDSNATFYGAFWCPECINQKKLFGNKASKSLPYVECSTPDRRELTPECQDADIIAFPTWEFADGTRQEGLIPLADLAAATNCPFPTLDVAIDDVAVASASDAGDAMTDTRSDDEEADGDSNDTMMEQEDSSSDSDSSVAMTEITSSRETVSARSTGVDHDAMVTAWREAYNNRAGQRTATVVSEDNGVTTLTYITEFGDSVSAVALENGVGCDAVTGYASGNANQLFPGELLTITKTATSAFSVASCTI